MYNQYYADGVKHRPDITFTNGSMTVTTDVTIVKQEGLPGARASRDAQLKYSLHRDAVRRLGHTFIPFVCEVTGFFDASCFALIKAIALLIDNPADRYLFKRDVIGGVQQSLASFRADALANTLNHTLKPNTHK